MSKVAYKKLAKYPHLRPEDIRVWEKFISKYPDFFKEVEYDSKVGIGRDYSMYPESRIRKDMEYLSKKRVDVIGYSDDSIYVIELKPKADLKAIGEAMGYAELVRDKVGPTKRVVPMIITDVEIPDMERVCSKLGVIYIVA